MKHLWILFEYWLSLNHLETQNGGEDFMTFDLLLDVAGNSFGVSGSQLQYGHNLLDAQKNAIGVAGYYLRLGFRKSLENDYLFTSVDGKFNISSQRVSWFYSWTKALDPAFAEKKYRIRPFKGPGVCLTRFDKTLVECRFRDERRQTICCRDSSK